MKLFLLGFVALGASTFSHAADWKYSTKHDSFYGKEELSAVLIGSGKGPLNNLTIYNDTKGTKFVTLSANGIDCFPTCIISVKFDDTEPEAFSASSSRSVSATVKIDNYDQFLRKVKMAKAVVFRLRFHDLGGDISFKIDAPFDEGRWDEATKLTAQRKLCERNAVNENFSDCMNKQAIRP